MSQVIPSHELPFSAPLRVARTADYAQTWTWLTSPTTTTTGTPVDLTGYTAEAIIYQVQEIESPLVVVTTSLGPSGVIALGGPNGTVELQLTHVCTASLPAVPLKWSLRVSSPAGVWTVLLAGNVTVTSFGPLP